MPNGTKGGVEHVADGKFLSIFENEVFAQIDSILPQRPRPGEKKILLNSPNGEHWTAILDTGGNMHSYGTGTAEPQTQPAASYWYVPTTAEGLTPPKWLYRTEENIPLMKRSRSGPMP